MNHMFLFFSSVHVRVCSCEHIQCVECRNIKESTTCTCIRMVRDRVGCVCRMMLVKSVGPYLSVRYILFQYTLVQEITVQYRVDTVDSSDRLQRISIAFCSGLGMIPNYTCRALADFPAQCG